MKAKYFTDKEVDGLITDLVYKLDRFREFMGCPVYLTETVAKGGSHVPDTAHATGEAADVTIRGKTDARPFSLKEQLMISWAAGRAGFSRVGIYNRHAHLDVAKDKPSPAIWTGESH